MKEPYGSIPVKARNWVAQEFDDVFYDQESLRDYIDDTAELDSSFRVRTAFVRRYQNIDDPEEEIVLDLYDMGSSEEAFGIFSCEREDKDIGVGQASEYGDGLLRFWQDRFFVSLVSLSNDDLEPVMTEIARGVADAIVTTGPRPALVERLPKDGLAEDQVRFFHTMQCLNHHFFLSSENILALDANTTCVFTRYERKDETAHLLLVEYPTSQKAEAARDIFVKAFIPEAEDAGAARMQNGRWIVASSDRNYVVVVFDAPEDDWARNLAAEVFGEVA
jgi:hypothetical protein